MFKRLIQRIKNIHRFNEALNRRVGIETELLMIAQGLKPLPNREQCRILALKLGTPKEHWPDEWKKKS